MLHFFVVILLSFILFFLSPINVFAQEESSIATPSAETRLDIDTQGPDSAIVGQSFSISFILTNATPNTAYFFKAYDAIYNSSNYVQTNCDNNTDWCNYTGDSWSKFPSFTTDSQGNISNSIILRFNPTKTDIPDQIQIALRTDPRLDSFNVKVVQVIKPEPSNTSTPSPSATSTPTNTPKPTSTTKPSSTPKPTTTIKPSSTPKPTSTLKPTLTPTLSISPSPTDTITDTPTLEPSPEILGEYDDITDTISFITPTATPSSKLNQANIFNIIPYFLITAGGGLLLTPTLITKLKKK